MNWIDQVPWTLVAILAGAWIIARQISRMDSGQARIHTAIVQLHEAMAVFSQDHLERTTTYGDKTEDVLLRIEDHLKDAARQSAPNEVARLSTFEENVKIKEALTLLSDILGGIDEMKTSLYGIQEDVSMISKAPVLDNGQDE
jgi:hypothetical protein